MNAFELSKKVEDFKRNYSYLETKLLSAVGQKVLVIENWADRYGISTKMRLGVLMSQPGTDPYKQDPLEVKFTELGILKTLETDMNYNLILPMEKHAEISNNRYNSSKWKLKDGPIIIPPYELMSLGQNAEHSIGRDGCFSHALRISKPAFVFETGENVEKYFRFHNAVSRYGRKTLQETAEFLKNRQDNEQWMDLSYVEALDLLGLPAPEDFRIKYNGKMRERKMDILGNLKKLTEKEAGLRGRINNIFASVKRGVYSRDGVGISVCENEDDAKVISIGSRIDLEKVQGEIRNYLARAGIGNAQKRNDY